jgi:hypothetical protein
MKVGFGGMKAGAANSALSFELGFGHYGASLTPEATYEASNPSVSKPSSAFNKGTFKKASRSGSDIWPLDRKQY